jgi:hypothetical protein
MSPEPRSPGVGRRAGAAGRGPGGNTTGENVISAATEAVVIKDIKTVELVDANGSKRTGVHFPFRLKDNFKRYFPSAKWNPVEKRREISARMAKALEQWIEVASGAAEPLGYADAIELTRQQLAALKNEINVLLHAARAQEQTAARLEQTVNELQAARAQIETARARKAAAEKAEQGRRAQIDAVLGAVIDVQAVVEAEEQMRKAWARGYGAGKREWHEAERVALAAQAALAEAGLRWDFCDRLCSRNFNRPDRDNYMPADSRYDVRVIKRQALGEAA